MLVYNVTFEVVKLNLNRKTNVLFCIILLFIITLVIFQYTVTIREPWFGELSDGHHQWLTGSTLEFTENWYNEGPLNLDFAMLKNPSSIEFPTLSSREPYLSYPPGTIIPIYLVSEIVNHKPTVGLIMDYNLFNHFLIAFFLALIIFFFLIYLKFDTLNSFLFSIIPIMLELLLPGPLYWQQNVFFSDQAVLLPFVVYVFLEVLRDKFRDSPKNKNILRLNILQNIVLFYGFLTDWLFVFIGITVYIKRIVDEDIVLSREMFLNKRINLFIKQTIKYWFAPLLALFLFLTQIYTINSSFNSIISKALFRMGTTSQGEAYLNNGLNIFVGYITSNYGHIAVALLAGSLTFFILMAIYLSLGRFKEHKNVFKIKKTLYLMGMLLIPCVLQVMVFRNHSVIHDFSVLKFSIPLATIPFVLVPILIFLFFENPINEKLKNIKASKRFSFNIGLLVLFLIIFTAASSYTVNEYPNYKSMFPLVNNTYSVIGNSLEKNTYYNDIAFSPNFNISINPPQQLSYSMKRVYQINSINDVKGKVENINGNYNIVIVFLNPPSNYWSKILSKVTPVKDNGIYYYIFSSNTTII